MRLVVLLGDELRFGRELHFEILNHRAEGRYLFILPGKAVARTARHLFGVDFGIPRLRVSALLPRPESRVHRLKSAFEVNNLLLLNTNSDLKIMSLESTV